jgi:hypothetical protein
MAGLGRPERSIVFHGDHTWGVEHYAPSSTDERWGTIYEDIRGRRWRLSGNTLIFRAPSDHGFKTDSEKITSFTQDKIVTDKATYTREK